jgi:hypothetical protein
MLPSDPSSVIPQAGTRSCMTSARIRSTIGALARNSLLAAHIVGNLQAGAEILQACMHLRANGHRRRSSRALSRAALLDREDTLAPPMAFGRVRTGLEQNYPIRILFYGEGAVTTALMTIWTEVCRALESILGQIMAGSIKLQHQKAFMRALYSSQ